MTGRKTEKIISNIVLVISSIVMLIPVYFLINNAFKLKIFIYKEPMILRPESFTTSNLISAFSLMRYPQAFRNSITILCISCFGLVLFGSLASFALVRHRTRNIKRLYVFIVSLITVPVTCAQIPLAKLLAKLGLINNWAGTSLVYIAFGLPFTIFVFYGYSSVIPNELWEASMIDGSNPVQSYLLIYLPLIKMAAATIIIMRGSYIWNDILVPLITISRGAQQTLPQRLVAFASNSIARWELMFAATLLISAPILLLYLLLQRTFISALTSGAIKG